MQHAHHHMYKNFSAFSLNLAFLLFLFILKTMNTAGYAQSTNKSIVTLIVTNSVLKGYHFSGQNISEKGGERHYYRVLQQRTKNMAAKSETTFIHALREPQGVTLTEQQK